MLEIFRALRKFMERVEVKGTREASEYLQCIQWIEANLEHFEKEAQEANKADEVEEDGGLEGEGSEG